MHDVQVYDAATTEQQRQQESVYHPTQTEETENMEQDSELSAEDNSRVAEKNVRNC